MKKTQIKDALRNIKKQRVSYLSIIIIAALAVTAYLGISYSAEAMRRSGNAFYSETNFRDVEIMSTLLMTEADLDAIRRTEGVADVEGVCQTSGKLENSGQHEDVYVVSLTERINRPVVVSGRLPETAGECALEQSVADTLGFTVGDTISVLDDLGGIPQFLTGAEYEVTGIVLHPDHLAKPEQVPGDRYVLVLRSAFDQEALEECYLKAEIVLRKDAGLNRFKDEYFTAVADTEARLSELAEERELLRYNELQGVYQSEIDDGQAQLDDAKLQLDDARAELDDGWQMFADSERELADGKTQLDEGKVQLDDAAAELADGKTQLEEGQAQIDSSYTQLLAAWNELNANEARLAEAEQELVEAKAQLDNGKSQLEAGAAELQRVGAEIAAGREELASGYEQLEDAKSTIRSALYSALSGVIGEYADRLSWGESAYGADVDSADVSATLLSVTDGITIDLERSMSDNIFSLIASLGIPEEELRDAFEAATGVYLELTDGTSLLDAVVSYAAARYAEYDSQYELLTSSARAWNDGHAAYIAGRAQYEAGLAEFDERSAEYNAGLAQYEEGLAEYNTGRAALDEAWEQYAAALAQYDAGRLRLSESRELYQDGLAEYEAGLEEYNDGATAYEEGLAELENGRTKLEESEAEYADGLAEYQGSVRQLDDARQTLAEMDECRWILFNVRGNGGYMHLSMSSESIANLSITFSLLFVVVGALVIYATIGRIVDEQRKLVGATKALGLFDREIMAKYLIFGVSATVLGALLGITIGYFGIQTVILTSYGDVYSFGAMTPTIQIPLTILATVVGAAISVLAMWLSCSQLMRSTAIQLMQDKTPGSSSSKARGGGSLYMRLILRNMRSDLPRVAVTIISVAGCCALLVIGFTIRFAVAGAIDRQYGPIVQYDEKLTFNPNKSDTVEAELEAILNDAGTTWIEVSDQYQTFRAGEELEIAELICGDLDGLADYYALRDWETGRPIHTAADGVFIQNRTAETSGTRAGDSILLYDAMMRPYRAQVAGVFSNYVGRTMVLSEEYYETLFDESASKNTYLIYLNGSDRNALAERLETVDGFESFETSAEERDKFLTYVTILTGITVMLTVVAGLMAYFILLNIANMYINQKKRELTVMRVNGFSVGEVKRYVSLETIATTALGILLGLAGGSLIGYKVIRFIELPHIQFVRSVSWQAWLFASVITVGFTLGINAIALRKVKNLKLTDVA